MSSLTERGGLFQMLQHCKPSLSHPHVSSIASLSDFVIASQTVFLLSHLHPLNLFSTQSPRKFFEVQIGPQPFPHKNRQWLRMVDRSQSKQLLMPHKVLFEGTVPTSALTAIETSLLPPPPTIPPNQALLQLPGAPASVLKCARLSPARGFYVAVFFAWLLA